MQCKCGSSSLIEKTNVPAPHTKAVHCNDCDAWIKWGGLNVVKLVEEGKHEIIIHSAQEKVMRKAGTSSMLARVKLVGSLFGALLIAMVVLLLQVFMIVCIMGLWPVFFMLRLMRLGLNRGRE